jgi:hypothetical protein
MKKLVWIAGGLAVGWLVVRGIGLVRLYSRVKSW